MAILIESIERFLYQLHPTKPTNISQISKNCGTYSIVIKEWVPFCANRKLIEEVKGVNMRGRYHIITENGLKLLKLLKLPEQKKG